MPELPKGEIVSFELAETDPDFKTIVDFANNRIPGHKLLESHPIMDHEDALLYFYLNMVNGVFDKVRNDMLQPALLIVNQLEARKLIQQSAVIKIKDALYKLAKERGLTLRDRVGWELAQTDPDFKTITDFFNNAIPGQELPKGHPLRFEADELTFFYLNMTNHTFQRVKDADLPKAWTMLKILEERKLIKESSIAYIKESLQKLATERSVTIE